MSEPFDRADRALHLLSLVTDIPEEPADLNTDPPVVEAMEKAFGKGYVKGYKEGFSSGWQNYRNRADGLVIDHLGTLSALPEAAAYIALKKDYDELRRAAGADASDENFEVALYIERLRTDTAWANEQLQEMKTQAIEHLEALRTLKAGKENSND